LLGAANFLAGVFFTMVRGRLQFGLEVALADLNLHIFVIFSKRVVLFFFVKFVLFELVLEFENFAKILNPLFFVEVHFVLNFNQLFLDYL
jgi:hypothetical protein